MEKDFMKMYESLRNDLIVFREGSIKKEETTESHSDPVFEYLGSGLQTSTNKKKSICGIMFRPGKYRLG